ncbi:MAG TPA: hypothetical protein VIB47_02270 [Dehalococcoidia bacterium]
MPFLPGYDWDETAPGFDPPTSPLVQPILARQMCSFHFGVPLVVPIAQLDALLQPLDFAAAELGQTGRSAIALAFGVHTRLLAGGATYGPFLNCVVIAPNSLNLNPAVNRRENLVLGSFISDNNARAVLNSLNGPDTSKAPGSYSVRLDETIAGSFKITVKVKLAANCTVTATVERPLADMVNRLGGQPQPGFVQPMGFVPPGFIAPQPPVPLRSTDGAVVQLARWAATVGDGVSFPAVLAGPGTPANPSLTIQSAPNNTLHLPVGALQSLGVNAGAPVLVRNNVEIISAPA